jgi:hypothetical protein
MAFLDRLYGQKSRVGVLWCIIYRLGKVVNYRFHFIMGHHVTFSVSHTLLH